MEQTEERSVIVNIPRSIGNTLLIAVNVIDGYIFRQHFEYLKLAGQRTPMVFGKDGFTVTRGNGTGTIVTQSRFHANKLLEYQFNTQSIIDANEREREYRASLGNGTGTGTDNGTDNGTGDNTNYDSDFDQSNPTLTINLNTPEFINHIKSLTKKSSIRLIHYAEHPDVVKCQLTGSARGSECTVFLHTEMISLEGYNIPHGIPDDAKPNAKTSMATFCASCNDLERARLAYCIFQCYPNAVTLYSANEQSTSGRVAHWTSDAKSNSSRIVSNSSVAVTRVPISVIKVMKKMGGWGVGIVSIYSRTSGYVRIDSSIGYFGDNTTYLIEQ